MNADLVAEPHHVGVGVEHVDLLVDNAIACRLIWIRDDRIRSIVSPLGEHFDYPYRCEMQVWKLNAEKTW
jgi:hypothetical protein